MVPCQGRRSEDRHTPEVRQVRNFYIDRYVVWDTANQRLLAPGDGRDPSWLESYRAVDQPEKHLVITDFKNLKSDFQRSILQKLDLLKAIRASLTVTFGAGSPAALPARPSTIFIGHGRSHVWRELKDFLRDQLGLPHEEFNREAAPGLTVVERLGEMLERCTFAFLVMTGEDEHADGSRHARENVVHEIGLFQGRLGFRRAIVLLEEGCAEFSNIQGLVQIRFPVGNVRASFEDVREVLAREQQLIAEARPSIAA